MFVAASLISVEVEPPAVESGRVLVTVVEAEAEPGAW